MNEDEEYITEEMIKKIMTPENIEKIKQSQKEIEEYWKEQKIKMRIDPKVLYEPFLLKIGS